MQSVMFNITIKILKEFIKGVFVDRGKEVSITKEYVDNLDIRTPSYYQLLGNLSGGNQQKAILARWLCMKPRLVIMDEPTRGIDVGAKREIEDLIRQMAGEGISVLLISSEFDELIRNCDRIEVIRDGVNMKTLTGDGISENNIIRAIADSGAAENEA